MWKIANVLYEMQYDMHTYTCIKRAWYYSDWYQAQSKAYHLVPIFLLVDALCGSSMS